MQAYLEQQIEEYDRVEQERMEERQMATKKILERMKIEQSNTIEGLLLLFCLFLNMELLICILYTMNEYLIDLKLQDDLININ